jgi:hypothetical protein
MPCIANSARAAVEEALVDGKQMSEIADSLGINLWHGRDPPGSILKDARPQSYSPCADGARQRPRRVWLSR